MGIANRPRPGRRIASPVIWTLALVAGTAASIALMWPCAQGVECRGGDHKGMALGLAALMAVLVALAYNLRKGHLKRAFLPMRQWLYAHVVIGTLALLLTVAHSGFHLENTVAAAAFYFLAATVVSGVMGLFIFYFLPRSEARHESSVLIPDELCQRLSQLHDEISELCSGREGAFLDVYNELVIPLYRTEGGGEPPSADVSPWADNASPEEAEHFMNLAAKVEEVHDLLVMLARHLRFRWWTQVWLLLHIPTTIGMMVFIVVHVISVAWFGVP